MSNKTSVIINKVKPYLSWILPQIPFLYSIIKDLKLSETFDFNLDKVLIYFFLLSMGISISILYMNYIKMKQILFYQKIVNMHQATTFRLYKSIFRKITRYVVENEDKNKEVELRLYSVSLEKTLLKFLDINYNDEEEKLRFVQNFDYSLPKIEKLKTEFSTNELKAIGFSDKDISIINSHK